MNKNELLKKIKAQAVRDQKKRRDPRFITTMGFLVAKGFLRTNLNIPMLPNKKLFLKDVLWAAQNVEPRILEVLPAAVLRLDKHFDFDPNTHQELARVIDQLRRHKPQGDAFYGVPYEKIKVWADLSLKDGRVKPLTKKRITKTFRLQPLVVEHLRKASQVQGCTETEVLEKAVMHL